jgi:hypothetical protein
MASSMRALTWLLKRKAMPRDAFEKLFMNLPASGPILNIFINNFYEMAKASKVLSVNTEMAELSAMKHYFNQRSGLWSLQAEHV